MHTKEAIKYNIWQWAVPAILVFALFIVFSPQADAGIVVEGDIEFRDEVNDCLNTYRDAPGVVGDAIKELENSEHEHKIINSPSWTNTPNDVDEATGGEGSGSVTRVDKEKLEEYLEQIEELENKDFCTAFLHELYHALDADRGTRSSHDVKIDGVKRNEVEATLFQNFIHAIRGVPPRTHYGHDISEHVVVGESEQETETDEEAEAEEQPEPPAEEEEQEQEEEQEESSTEASMDYEHVAPGEYSEIYVTVITNPGAQVNATLSGPGVDSSPAQNQTADAEGVAQFTWRIVSFGAYSVTGTANGEAFSSEINVQ